MGRSIGILSLKGGVGKTSVVVSLGDAISGFGKKVLLVDGNFSAPNLGLHLNVVNPAITMHHVLARKANIKDAVRKLDNFDMIPSSVFSNYRLNPFELKEKLKPLRRRYDVLLIDSSPALNEETLAVMLASDSILIITTPDVPSISTAIKAIKLAKQKDVPISGLINNKAHNKNFDLSLDEIEKTADVPVLAIIPYDIEIQKSLSNFVPSTRHKPNSKSSKEYKKLAGVLIGEKYKPFSFRNILRLSPKKVEINREIYYDRVFG